MKKYIFLLAILLAVAWAGQAWGATYYVAPGNATCTAENIPNDCCTEAAGGTCTGDDAAAGAVDTPWATFGKARVTATTNGDIVYFADGVYNSTEGASGETAFNLVKGVTWRATNAGQVTWKANHATQVVYVSLDNNQTATINGIIIDATGTQQAQGCFRFNSGKTGTTLALNGVSMINFTQYGINCTVTGVSFDIDNITLTSTGFYKGIYIVNNTGGTININGVVSNLSSAGSYSTHRIIDIDPGAASGSTVEIQNVTGSMTLAHASGYGIAIKVDDTSTVSIHDNNFSFTVASTTACRGISVSNEGGYVSNPVVSIYSNTLTQATNGYGIVVENINGASIYSNVVSLDDVSAVDSRGISYQNTGATYTAHNGRIYSNTVTLLAAIGSGIYNGASNTSTDTANNANNTWIYSNTLTGIEAQTGTPHGINSESCQGTLIYKNKVTQFCPAILLAKTDSTAKAYYNIITKPYGNFQLYAKGATGSIFSNNTVYSYTDFNGVCIGMAAHSDATNNSGVLFKNNLCYNSSVNPVFVKSAANQTGTFTKNLYYASEALIATSWQYGGSNYATYATWQVIEPFAVWGDPLFVDTTDYELDTGSPAKNAGWCGSRAVSMTDYNGTTIIGRPDIGAQESATLGAMCGQRNLNLLWLGR